MNRSFLNGLLDQIVERGRSLLDLSLIGLSQDEAIEDLATALLSGRGESSGTMIAQHILSTYRMLDKADKLAFFIFLNERFAADQEAVTQAANAYLEHPGPDTLKILASKTEAPRQEFFHRLNLAPGGTADIVAMRVDLLGFLKDHPELSPVDDDLVHLFGSWFNRGFLVPRRIDWATPAAILEKIIEYEAVHEIRGWDDLKRRLDPSDRRCYGFFHPSLVDEPLIFVEVALTRDIPASIQDLLSEDRSTSAKEPNTAVFYSISNCQKGLAGIAYGNFLIKQVVTDLAREIAGLKTFVTLSPIPTFGRWLEAERANSGSAVLAAGDRKALSALDRKDWHRDRQIAEELKEPVVKLAAKYLISVKDTKGRPLDPVARFHLGNGARLERINWLADTSENGLRQSAGLMVNYLYELKDIERNHEAFANDGKVAAASAVLKAARMAEKTAKPVSEPAG